MKRRLVGGLILLNLCAISLSLSAGEQDITNNDVLDQLVGLREYIDEKRDFTKESKGLKPVLVQYRSSVSKIDGVVECNLSFNTDALHLSIGGYSVQADGTPITITINVVYEWTEYIGYTIKSAKINATNEFNALKITGDEIIENMSGYSCSFGETPAGLTIEPIYAGCVKNGNKLTFVTAFNITRTGDAVSGLAWDFTCPSEIMAKLYPSRIGSYDYLSVHNVDVWASDSTSASIQIYATKSGLKVHYGTNQGPIAELGLDTKYYVRVEDTFLLSDNLSPSGE